MEKGREIISTENLAIGYSKSHGNSMVMKEINVSAFRGELIALIGKNGSGKSTLLRTMTGMQQPLSGSVFMKRKKLNDISRTDLTKTISFTSTEPIDLHNIKVYEAVALGRFPYTNWLGTISHDDHIVIDESLNLTGLSHLADRKIDRLSDGERQRVLIARSLAQDTELLVMDEPTAFLDLPSRYSIVSLLRKLSREKKKCIIYSTHDLDTAINEADKLWLMKSGKISQGAPEDLVINRSLAEAFESPSLSFNISSGTFRLVRSPKGSVRLEGSGYLRRWTERALVRGDFRIETSAKYLIKTPDVADDTGWQIITPGGEIKHFTSIYDLINYLDEEPSVNLK